MDLLSLIGSDDGARNKQADTLNPAPLPSRQPSPELDGVPFPDSRVVEIKNTTPIPGSGPGESKKVVFGPKKYPLDLPDPPSIPEIDTTLNLFNNFRQSFEAIQEMSSTRFTEQQPKLTFG
ncbi:MAG: hypothetical protein QNK37_19240 [Acidobacteriota bacterium]|nr:hypothetical protein [Acidobacteriota bacterium]